VAAGSAVVIKRQWVGGKGSEWETGKARGKVGNCRGLPGRRLLNARNLGLFCMGLRMTGKGGD